MLAYRNYSYGGKPSRKISDRLASWLRHVWAYEVPEISVAMAYFRLSVGSKRRAITVVGNGLIATGTSKVLGHARVH